MRSLECDREKVLERLAAIRVKHERFNYLAMRLLLDFARMAVALP